MYFCINNLFQQTNWSVTCVLIIANTNCNPSLSSEILHSGDYRKLSFSVFLSHAFF